MIYNVAKGTFGNELRMGDIVALANVVEHFRNLQDSGDIKFFVDKNAIQNRQYCHEFYQWMTENTDYFSSIPGQEYLPWRRVNLWDYRDIAGDLVSIPNKQQRMNKIVICPVVNSDYNVYRNWPNNVLSNIIKECKIKYSNYEKVILSQNEIEIPGYRNSTNLLENLYHIQTSSLYIGGDTGLSHFAGALEQGPEPLYYMSSRGLIHTLPFNLLSKHRGQIKTYWLDFEQTKWE